MPETAQARIERSEVLRYLGYAGQDIAAELSASIDEAIAACSRELEPHSVWSTYRLSRHTEEGRTLVAVDGTALVLRDASIVAYLQGADRCALIACTLGMAGDRRLRQLGMVDPLSQLLYDAAASALVESGAEAVSRDIERWAAGQGMHTGYRFSPGYADFSLSVQPQLLAALDATRRLGMTVTDSMMLVPSKSITAVVGIYPGTVPDRAARKTCAGCPCLGHCAWRLHNTTCHSEPREPLA